MDDRQYLEKALRLATQSPEPIGCGVVIVSDGKIIAQEYNSQRKDNVAINHAEIKAIVSANKKVGKRKLANATAYCSCEPCVMCITALSYAGVERIIYQKSMYDLFPDDPQSKFDTTSFISGLNYVPEFIQIKV